MYKRQAPDSPHHINPMDIDLSFDEENPMALKADFILSLMELIVGGKDGLQPVERTVIDRCVRQMYREHLQNPETAEMPTLQTLYDLLCAQPEGEAVRLATSLEIYVSGSLNVFNHKTNVDLNRRLVCLDLKKLGAGLRTIAMLIMQDLVNSQVSMNFLREMCIRDRVGTTPADWNAGGFSMIRQISETAILPIAGVILTFVMTYELIQMLIERNNLHEVDTWMFFK